MTNPSAVCRFRSSSCCKLQNSNLISFLKVVSFTSGFRYNCILSGLLIYFFFNAFCHWSYKNQTVPLCARIREAAGIKDSVFVHPDVRR